MAEFITVKVPFSQSTRAVGPIGHDGENVVRRVLFDCHEVLKDRPDASIVCVIQRPDGSAPYMAPLEKTDEDGVYSLTIREVDVEKNGLVKMELRRIDGESVLKSDIITGVVKESITAEPAEPGDPEADMLTELAKAAANAQGMADYIQEKLNNGEFTGAQGPQGVQGEKGDTGATGAKGDAGDLITDTVTGSTFRFAMENGYLYFEEVSAT